jgi:hypothetical protein
VPLLDGDAVSVAELIKNVQKALCTVRGQRDSVMDGVKEPAKDHFQSAPRAVAFAKLLDGNGLVAMGVGRGQRSKHGVNGV